MKYEFLKNDKGVKIFAKIDDDGVCRETCSEDNPNYLQYLKNSENADK